MIAAEVLVLLRKSILVARTYGNSLYTTSLQRSENTFYPGADIYAPRGQVSNYTNSRPLLKIPVGPEYIIVS